jgi:DNA processing protein
MEIPPPDGHINNRNLQEALNYETLISCSGKSDSTIEPLFDQLGGSLNLSIPLLAQPNTYAALIGKPVSQLLEAYYHTQARFLRLSSDDFVIKRGDVHYPHYAAVVPYSPRFLYARGDVSLLSHSIVCVVGTRNPSDEGKQYARESTKAIGTAHGVVASGLALGIDGVAHLTSLAENIPTMAVIGTSLLDNYPSEHAGLQRRIGEKGLLLSRFAPSASTQKWFFLLRNRLMSSLSIASVLVEDRDGGGAVKQAGFALEQGRTVILYKHTVENRSILWPRRLISSPTTVVIRKPNEIPGLLAKTIKASTNRSIEKAPDIQFSLFESP